MVLSVGTKCPDCGTTLKSRSMPGVGEEYWYCSKCPKEWNTGILIQILAGKETEKIKSGEDYVKYKNMGQEIVKRVMEKYKIKEKDA